MNSIMKTTPFILLGMLGNPAAADENQVRQAIAQAMPSVEIDAVEPSVVKGLYEVRTGANLFYVSDDGKYILQGKLYDLQNRVDLTEEKLAGIRVAELTSLGQEKMIIFKPEKSLYQVSVFTDIDCGYCRKLHSEIDQYLAQGITVRYLFYPRAGKGSESYKKAVSVWCAKDHNAALTSAKQGKNPEQKTCDNPVDRHMQLARDFGVQGTPMLVTGKGSVYPGYLPASQLAKVLKAKQQRNP